MKLNQLFNNGLVGALIVALLTILQPHFSPAPQAPAAVQPAAIEPTRAPVQTNDLICDTGHSIQVSGSAAINVTPDRVSIQLGVETNGLTPSLTLADNTNRIEAIVAALQSLGIEKKDITTDQYVTTPVYDNYSSLYIKGYRMDNVIAVTVRDVTQASSVVVTALESGANQVLSVEFYTSDLRTYRDQARALAMQAAKEKAQALAEAAGSEAGCVTSISENTWSYYQNWYWWGGYNQSQMTQNVIQNAAPTGSGDQQGNDTPVSPGQIVVKAEINASFSLK